VKTKRKKTYKRHPSTIHFFSFIITSTGNEIGDTGATSLSEALKSNTTLIELNMSCEDKRRHTKDIHQQFTLFSFIITSTVNKIGDTGATSLSEALKSNTALTKLDLFCEDKRKKTQKRHPSTIHSFFSHHINRQQDWRHRNNII
jgi:hypothetical protein